MTGGGVPRPAPANKTALAARVRNAARSTDLPEGRVQRQLGVLVVAELLGRVRNENGQQLFLVKGGSSIELRLGVASSRTTKDLDALLAEAVGSQLASALDLTGFSWMRTTRNATEYGSDRHPSATAVDVDEAIEMATTIHQRAGRVLDDMYPY